MGGFGELSISAIFLQKEEPDLQFQKFTIGFQPE